MLIVLYVTHNVCLLFWVVRTLIRFGANPDLRDEEGKTPLDKGRERDDEGHREVCEILETPGEWQQTPKDFSENGKHLFVMEICKRLGDG